MTEPTSESLYWAKRAHRQMVARWRERIAMVAYSMAETRGFEPGHDAEDWLRAQLHVNAQDAGINDLR